MPQTRVARIGRFAGLMIVFGVALVAVFTDRTRLGRSGIGFGVGGWLLLLGCSAVHRFARKPKLPRVPVIIGGRLFEWPPRDDGSIIVEGEPVDPAIAAPVVRLRRQ